MPPTFDSSSQNVWTFVLRKFWQRKASENDSTDWLQYSEPGISCRLTEFQGTSANGLAALHLDIDWQVGNGTTLVRFLVELVALPSDPMFTDYSQRHRRV